MSALLPVLLVLAATPLPGATNETALTRFCDVAPEKIGEVHAEVRAHPTVRARVLDASERFLGVRYGNDPLGEGRGQPPDEDPRLRWDEVDCTTYVETVIALARARSAEEIEPVLQTIRYDGDPGYAQRNHFYEAQWLQANQRKGFLRDVTAEIAGPVAVAHIKEITLTQWRGRTAARGIVLPGERAPVGAFPISYVPLARVASIAGRIPSGTVFAVVREDRARSPFMVTHLGFVVQRPRGTVVRHAGRDRYNQVVDEDLEHFLRRNARYKWKVLGLQLLEVLDGPGLRL